jgi:hypothetical protein
LGLLITEGTSTWTGSGKIKISNDGIQNLGTFRVEVPTLLIGTSSFVNQGTIKLATSVATLTLDGIDFRSKTKGILDVGASMLQVKTASCTLERDTKTRLSVNHDNQSYSCGRLVIENTVALSGELIISLASGQNPSLDYAFQVLTYGIGLGSFRNVYSVGHYGWRIGYMEKLAILRRNLTADEVISLLTANNHSSCSTELLVCLIWKESSFNPEAKNSGSTATGLMAITKAAVRDVNSHNSPDIVFEHSDMTDAAKNIDCGTRYLSILIDRWGGDLVTALEHFGTGAGYATALMKCEHCIQNTPSNNREKCLKIIHP